MERPVCSFFTLPAVRLLSAVCLASTADNRADFWSAYQLAFAYRLLGLIDQHSTVRRHLQRANENKADTLAFSFYTQNARILRFFIHRKVDAPFDWGGIRGNLPSGERIQLQSSRPLVSTPYCLQRGQAFLSIPTNIFSFILLVCRRVRKSTCTLPRARSFRSMQNERFFDEFVRF